MAGFNRYEIVGFKRYGIEMDTMISFGPVLCSGAPGTNAVDCAKKTVANAIGFRVVSEAQARNLPGVIILKNIKTGRISRVAFNSTC